MKGCVDMNTENKDLIQAISNMMDEKLDPLKADIAELKQGQAKMQGDIAKLEQGQAKLEKETRNISQSVAVIEMTTVTKLDLISEGLTGWQERNKQIDRHETELENHDHRIFALEQVAKK